MREILVLLSFAAGAAQTAGPGADTPIELMVMQEVSARTATPGMRFRLETLRATGDIPAGTTAWGEVTDAEPAGRRGRGGRIGARLLHIEWGGRQIMLTGGSGTEARGAARSVSALSASLGPFALLAKGHDARLKAGETIIGYIAGTRDAAAPARDPILPADTPVTLETLVPLSSETMPRGAVVPLAVAEDIRIDGALVVPKGARAFAQIARVEPKAAFGQGGRLVLTLHYVELGDRVVRLRGDGRWTARDSPTRGLSSSPLTGAVAVAITGRRIELPAGIRIIGHVLRDTPVPRR